MKRIGDIPIWRTGNAINAATIMEAYINNAVLIYDQGRRAQNRRSQSPDIHRRAAILTVMI